MTTATPRAPRTPARAEPVGSLIRDPRIMRRLHDAYAGHTTALQTLVVTSRPDRLAQVNELADEAIRELVRRQVDAGLDVVTDGEVRRPSFLHAVYDSVDGLDQAEERQVVRDEHGGGLVERFGRPVVADRIRKTSSPLAQEVTFLRAITDFPFKVTLPAPSKFLMDFVAVRDGGAYASRAEFVDDIVEVEKAIVGEAIAAGARWIQFDFPIYPALAAEGRTAGAWLTEAYADGETDASLLEKALAADRAVTEVIPGHVTVAMHMCRGNLPGGFWDGSLEPIADRLFTELPHHRFLLEWDDVSRDGTYAPIRHVPEGRIVSMGLVSTRSAELESADDIVRRVEEAARHLDVDQLALTSQCGFASMGTSVAESEALQWRKLELLGGVAERIWGA